MSIFDWIPTVEEVIDFIDCRIMGHDWVYDLVSKTRTCQQCKKVERTT
jgi:hypothetical protein